MSISLADFCLPIDILSGFCLPNRYIDPISMPTEYMSIRYLTASRYSDPISECQLDQSDFYRDTTPTVSGTRRMKCSHTTTVSFPLNSHRRLHSHIHLLCHLCLIAFVYYTRHASNPPYLALVHIPIETLQTHPTLFTTQAGRGETRRLGGHLKSVSKTP